MNLEKLFRVLGPVVLLVGFIAFTYIGLLYGQLILTLVFISVFLLTIYIFLELYVRIQHNLDGTLNLLQAMITYFEESRAKGNQDTENLKYVIFTNSQDLKTQFYKNAIETKLSIEKLLANKKRKNKSP